MIKNFLTQGKIVYVMTKDGPVKCMLDKVELIRSIFDHPPQYYFIDLRNPCHKIVLVGDDNLKDIRPIRKVVANISD